MTVAELIEKILNLHFTNIKGLVIVDEQEFKEIRRQAMRLKEEGPERSEM